MHCCPHNTDKFVEVGLLFPDVWLGDSPKAKSRDRLLPKDLSRIQSENEEDLYPWHLLKGGYLNKGKANPRDSPASSKQEELKILTLDRIGPQSRD